MAYRRRLLGLVILGVLLRGGGALAQLDSTVLSKIQVNLVNPGGKSLALGGAFVSLADDATAAIANPAGLAQERSWEVAASGKWMQFSPDFQQYVLVEGSGFTDLRSTSISKNVAFPEFISVSGPIAKDVSLSIYRAVNLRYTMSTDDLPGQRYAIVTIQTKDGRIVTEQEFGGIDVTNVAYGLSAGARFGPVSIGGGLTLNKISFDLTGNGGNPYQIQTNNDAGGAPPAIFPLSASVDSALRVGGILGFKAELVEQIRLAIGGVYRWTPSYDVSYATTSNGKPATCATDASLCGGIKVPHDFSLGISARPVSHLLIAFDVQRVFYSDLTDRGASAVFYTGWTGPNSTGTFVNAVAVGSMEDRWIPRVGAEWSLPFDDFQLFLRAGYHREPAHGMTLNLYQSSATNPFIPDKSKPVTIVSPPISQALSATGAFNGGKADDVVSFGVGASIARRLSIDAAFEFGKVSKSATLSAFYRF